MGVGGVGVGGLTHRQCERVPERECGEIRNH